MHLVSFMHQLFSTIIQDLAFKVLLYKQCTLVIGIRFFCCVLLYSAASLLCFLTGKINVPNKFSLLNNHSQDLAWKP